MTLTSLCVMCAIFHIFPSFVTRMQSEKQAKFDSSKNSVKDEDDKTSIFENIREYLLSTSLHGLRYVGTSTLSLFERVFFSLAFFSVILLAAYFISNIWQKWKVR